MDKMDKSLMCAHDKVAVDNLEHEVSELRFKLDDWQESHNIIINEQCPGDERHCTCVPALRQQIKAREQQIYEQKELLESALAIAKRKGENTYWKGFIDKVEQELNKY